MTTLQPTMLWEATDANDALQRRFGFPSTAATTAWLAITIDRVYGLQLQAVERLTISAYNLLAWFHTADGAYIAKCCALTQAHPQLLQRAELVTWLHQQALPVSPFVCAQTGERQVRCAQLSLGLQRIMPGQLLDPTQILQAQRAGETLAQLHKALAAYPQAMAMAPATAIAAPAQLIDESYNAEPDQAREPISAAGHKALSQCLHNRVGEATLPVQLIHGDYRAANILWDAETISAILDFEDARWGYRVSDLAWAAVHLATRYRAWGPVSPTVEAAFIASYRACQPLSAIEALWLPRLLLWHSLRLARSASGGPTHAACLAAVQAHTQHLAGA